MQDSKQAKPSPITVKTIRFTAAIDVPFRGMRETLTAGLRDGYTAVMVYEPWTRHHRITISREKESGTVMVHEAQVRSWSPE
jgi:hypothetical protein